MAQYQTNDTRINISKSVAGVYLPDLFNMCTVQLYDGGRASRKTSRHAARIVIESITRPNLISFVMAKSSDKLETGLFSEFQKVIERVTDGTCIEGKDYELRKKPLAIKFTNGSEIHFLGSANWGSLKGRSVPSKNHQFGFILFDEFADYDEKNGPEMFDVLEPTFTRDDYKGPWRHIVWKENQLDLSYELKDEDGNYITYIDEEGVEQIEMYRGKHTAGCKFLFASNPPKNKYHWYFDFVKEIERRHDAFVKKVNYTDIRNELITSGQSNIVAQAENMKHSNLLKYRHVWLGEATSTDGLYFATFEPEKARITELPQVDPRNWAVGVDFGTTNPTTFVLMGIDNQGTRIIPEFYYHTNRNNGDEKGSMAYAEDLIEFCAKAKKKYNIPGLITVFYDPSAKGFRNDVVELQKRRGRHTCTLHKAVNDRQKTLSHLYDLIIEEQIKYIYPNKHADQFEDEILRAETHPKGDDIVKENDHFIDATRYVAWKLKRKARRY